MWRPICSAPSATRGNRGRELCERDAVQNPSAVDVVACSHAYGAVDVLRGIDLRVGPGELVSLLGKSGSGKTTLLRIIAGLVHPTRGSIAIDGEDVTNRPPEKRDIGVVFQNYALFPHLTMFENIAFPLRVRGVDRAGIRHRVREVLELVGLPGFENRFPGQLSGGQQQRVAIARAIVFRPRLLLMDEPLGSLDQRLRQQLQVELRRLQKEVGITTVYVTHDQDEAFAISDRIAVMDRGEILQIGSPTRVYQSPANRLVAEFVGELNVFHGCRIVGADDGPVLRTQARASTSGSVRRRWRSARKPPAGCGRSACWSARKLTATAFPPGCGRCCSRGGATGRRRCCRVAHKSYSRCPRRRHCARVTKPAWGGAHRTCISSRRTARWLQHRSTEQVNANKHKAATWNFRGGTAAVGGVRRRRARRRPEARNFLPT